MKNKFQSIRFRLTAYFLLIFISLLILISGIILYNYKSYNIDRGKNSLRDKSFVIGAWIDFSEEDINSQIDDYISSQNEDIMIQLFDRKANLIGRSASFKSTMNLPEQAWLEVVSQDEAFLYESAKGDYLIAVNNLFDKDQVKGFVQIVQTKKSILNNYHYLFRIILIAVIVSIIIAFMAGIFLVNQMLIPINKIMAIVGKMQAEKLDSARLQIINPHDEIGRLSITINELLDRIQKAISNQRQFLSDAAHELRTPLTILKGNTEVALIKQKTDSPILSKNLEEINHLISLTNDLLLIARFDSQTKAVLKEGFNFSTMLEDTVSNFYSKAVVRNISINCDVEKNIQIYADTSLMKRVIYNILDNALKYSPDRSNIYISLEKTANKGFSLAIKDEGVGIPPDKLSLIFERFYRVSEDRNKNIEGTGLGLAIVKSIVQVHDFQLNVESELNKGSSFIVVGEIYG